MNKKIIFTGALWALLLSAQYSIAQTTTSTTTKTTETTKSTAPSLLNNNYKKLDYLHAELAWHNWANKPDSLKTKWFNRTISLYGTYPFKLGKSNFSFVVGAGFTVDNFYSNGYLYNDSSFTVLRPITAAYKSNKLTTAHIIAPINFTYTFKQDKYNKALKASLGMRFGYLLSAHTKYVGNNSAGASQKVKYYSVPYINKYRFEASATFGYDWFYVVANYSLNTYFANGKGIVVHPFTIGLGVVGF